MTSIELNRLSFGYRRGNAIFEDVRLRMEHDAKRHGCLIAIMGPSGSGKTTLLRLIARVEAPVEGTVDLMPSDAQVSYLQQEPVLFEHLSRLENARYFGLVRERRSQFDELTFDRLAKRLKLTTVINDPGSVEDMSGGERQRLALLRALSIRPRILLLDEPGTGLDVDVKLELLHVLREVVDEFGLLALYVTHHSEEAEIVADELLYLPPAASRHPGMTFAPLPLAEACLRPPSP